jgi:hypothetical protein
MRNGYLSMGRSPTRLLMELLLLVAIPIFIGRANKAVRENAGAIQQGSGR